MTQPNTFICNCDNDKTLGITLSIVRLVDCFVIQTINYSFPLCTVLCHKEYSNTFSMLYCEMVSIRPFLLANYVKGGFRKIELIL